MREHFVVLRHGGDFTLPADIQEALDLGIHVFAGEVEGHMADILREIAAGTAELVYNMPEMRVRLRRGTIGP